MKKKILKVTLLICGILLIGLLVRNLTDCATVSVDGQTAEISFSDSWQLRATLMPEEICFGGSGCPFYTDYSVRIGGLTYCIAMDDCETVWVKELNLYYSVPKEQHAKLEEKMLEHGKQHRLLQ